MAWQLIYSSAPRLLDAGLTGFGTVARHRAIPPLVVKAIERISQFARLPGYPVDRIIFCHRTLTVGGARFHVLSRLRDAGSDYSGRTNHIAHHLVVSAQEAAQLPPGSATPADILLQMAWLDRWDAGPEWLHDDSLVPLQRFVRADSTDRAWEALSGNPSNCWLLVNGRTARSACLIHPTGTDPLPLIAASQHAQPTTDAWQSAFTTALQPTDEAQEFRWISIAADSPLRGPMESSGRPLLDLTNPASLPPPELPPAPAAPSAAVPSQPATSAPLPGNRYTPPPPTTRTASPPGVLSHPDGRKGSPRSDPSEGQASRFLIPALIGITAAAAGTAAFLWFSRPRLPTTPPKADTTALLQQINNAKSLADLRNIKTENWQQNTRADLIERIQELETDPAKLTFEAVYPLLTEIREKAKEYKNEDASYDYAKDTIRKFLEIAALDSLQRSRPTESKVIDQLKQYAWMSRDHETRATALTRTPEPAAPAPSTPTPPAVATAPTPPPEPTPAPPPTLRSQHSLVASFDDLESLSGPVRDDTFWDPWKSNVEIRRGGQSIRLVPDSNGSRFTEENKGTKGILSIKGPILTVLPGEIDSIEAIILTDKQTRWEITTNPPTTPRLPATANLTWNQKEATFTFTGKASETLASWKLHGNQSLQFILNHPNKPADLPHIPIKGIKSDSLLPFLNPITTKAIAKLEDNPEFAKLQKELTEIGEKLNKIERLADFSKQLKAEEAKTKKVPEKISSLQSEINLISETPDLIGSVGLLDSRITTARAKHQTQKRPIDQKLSILREKLEKEIDEAKAVVADFAVELPYGGVGKVYLVTAGGGRAGSKGSHVILEITEP
jgi:hypothetical protein